MRPSQWKGRETPFSVRDYREPRQAMAPREESAMKTIGSLLCLTLAVARLGCCVWSSSS